MESFLTSLLLRLPIFNSFKRQIANQQQPKHGYSDCNMRTGINLLFANKQLVTCWKFIICSGEAWLDCTGEGREKHSVFCCYIWKHENINIVIRILFYDMNECSDPLKREWNVYHCCVITFWFTETSETPIPHRNRHCAYAYKRNGHFDLVLHNKWVTGNKVVHVSKWNEQASEKHFIIIHNKLYLYVIWRCLKVDGFGTNRIQWRKFKNSEHVRISLFFSLQTYHPRITSLVFLCTVAISMHRNFIVKMASSYH